MKRKINIKSIAIMIIVVGFFYVVKSQFPHYKVSSQSMIPAFLEGDIIIVNNLINKEDILRSDVCVIEHNEEIYISRVVGIPGDEIEIRDGKLFVNEQEEIETQTCFNYKIKLGNHPPLAENDLLLLLNPINEFEEYEAILNKEQVLDISNFNFVKSIHKITHPRGYNYTFSNNPIYPNLNLGNWSRDNFGPIKLKEKGAETGNKKVKLKNNYYFVLGDNRHKSLDSRHWGLIPETSIKGKFISKLYSKE
jgi:signal peptidase I